jgi:hypothetical protein
MQRNTPYLPPPTVGADWRRRARLFHATHQDDGQIDRRVQRFGNTGTRHEIDCRIGEDPGTLCRIKNIEVEIKKSSGLTIG